MVSSPIEPDVIRAGKTRAQLIASGFGALPRLKNGHAGWTFNGHDYEITQVEGDKYSLVTDVQVRDLSGNVVFDDRVRNGNPPLLFMQSDGTTVEDYFLVLRSQLDTVAGIVTGGFKNLHDKRTGANSFSGDTLAQRAATTDGGLLSSDPTFTTMKTGGGTLTADTTATTYVVAWDAGYSGRMFFVEFDTSALTSLATITAAVGTLYGATTAEVNTNTYNADWRYKDWGGTVTTADWFDPSSSGAWNALVAGGVLAVSSWDQTSGNPNNFSDSGVYTSISKTSLTRFVIGLSGMNASTPTGDNEFKCQSADASGTSADPLFTVTYSLPAGYPNYMDVASQAHAALLGY